MFSFRNSKGQFRKAIGCEKFFTLMCGSFKAAFYMYFLLLVLAFFTGFYKRAKGNKQYHACDRPYIKAIYLVPSFLLGCSMGERVEFR